VKFGPRFKPLFAAQAAGHLRFAVMTITIAEVLTGPLRSGDDALARRYRAFLESWQPILTSTLRKALQDCGPHSGSSWQMPFKRQARWRSTRPPWRHTIAISHTRAPCV
jgi:hypothetical protein